MNSAKKVLMIAGVLVVVAVAILTAGWIESCRREFDIDFRRATQIAQEFQKEIAKHPELATVTVRAMRRWTTDMDDDIAVFNPLTLPVSWGVDLFVRIDDVDRNHLGVLLEIAEANPRFQTFRWKFHSRRPSKDIAQPTAAASPVVAR